MTMCLLLISMVVIISCTDDDDIDMDAQRQNWTNASVRLDSIVFFGTTKFFYDNKGRIIRSVKSNGEDLDVDPNFGADSINFTYNNNIILADCCWLVYINDIPSGKRLMKWHPQNRFYLNDGKIARAVYYYNYQGTYHNYFTKDSICYLYKDNRLSKMVRYRTYGNYERIGIRNEQLEPSVTSMTVNWEDGMITSIMCVGNTNYRIDYSYYKDKKAKAFNPYTTQEYVETNNFLLPGLMWMMGYLGVCPSYELSQIKVTYEKKDDYPWLQPKNYGADYTYQYQLYDVDTVMEYSRWAEDEDGTNSVFLRMSGIGLYWH